jgi:hypothetical protein
VLGRPYFYRKVLLEPGGQAIVHVTYQVPDAAKVSGDSLVYGLDIDPQATVAPAAFNVTLHLPKGYGLGATPVGWTLVDGRTLQFTGGALDENRRFVIDVSKL